MRVLIPIAMLVAALPTTMAFINILLYSGTGCTGTRASTTRPVRGTCIRLNVDVLSGETHQNSNSDCLATYYGSNCEEGTLVAIQDGGSPCGNYWGTVRSIKGVVC